MNMLIEDESLNVEVFDHELYVKFNRRGGRCEQLTEVWLDNWNILPVMTDGEQETLMNEIDDRLAE